MVCIYLDSNVVVSLGPELSGVEAKGLFSLAQEAVSPIYTFPLVLIESARTVAGGIVKSLGDAKKITGGREEVLGITRLPDVPTVEDASDRIEKLIKVRMSEVGIGLMPEDIQGWSEFSESIVRRVDRKGNKGTVDLGYRDSIILLSVIAHMRTKNCEESILVTDDWRLSRPDVKDILEDFGVENLNIFTIEETKKFLRDQLSERARADRVELETKIKEFIWTNKKQIEELVLKNKSSLSRSLSDWLLSSSIEILSADVIEISELSLNLEGGEAERNRKYSVGFKTIFKTSERITETPGTSFRMSSSGGVESIPPGFLRQTTRIIDNERGLKFEATLFWEVGRFVSLEGLKVSEEPPTYFSTGGVISY